MLMHIDDTIDRDILEVICAFDKERETEIADYAQNEGSEYVLLYVGKIYEVFGYRTISYVATLYSVENQCDVLCNVPEFPSPLCNVDVVSMQSENYDRYQITWIMYRVKLEDYLLWK